MGFSGMNKPEIPVHRIILILIVLGEDTWTSQLAIYLLFQFMFSCEIVIKYK